MHLPTTSHRREVHAKDSIQGQCKTVVATSLEGFPQNADQPYTSKIDPTGTGFALVTHDSGP